MTVATTSDKLNRIYAVIKLKPEMANILADYVDVKFTRGDAPVELTQVKRAAIFYYLHQVKHMHVIPMAHIFGLHRTSITYDLVFSEKLLDQGESSPKYKEFYEMYTKLIEIDDSSSNLGSYLKKEDGGRGNANRVRAALKKHPKRTRAYNKKIRSKIATVTDTPVITDVDMTYQSEDKVRDIVIEEMDQLDILKTISDRNILNRALRVSNKNIQDNLPEVISDLFGVMQKCYDYAYLQYGNLRVVELETKTFDEGFKHRFETAINKWNSYMDFLSSINSEMAIWKVSKQVENLTEDINKLIDDFANMQIKLGYPTYLKSRGNQ